MGDVSKKRKYNLRLIRLRRTYTISELAKLLGVHARTVQSWHKQGLKPINPDEGRHLFMGSMVREFLRNRQAKRKHPLKEDEFYCPRCHQARQSKLDKIQIVFTKKKMGKHDMQVIIKDQCAVCECGLNRFSTENRLKNSFWSQFLVRAESRLRGNNYAPVNTDLRGGKNDEN